MGLELGPYDPEELLGAGTELSNQYLVQMRGLNASGKKQRILTMVDLLKHSSNEHVFEGPNVATKRS
jgi:hypothetical protein